jgi:hypothetical protein
MKASCGYVKKMECLRAISPDTVMERVWQVLNHQAPGLSLNRTPVDLVD